MEFKLISVQAHIQFRRSYPEFTELVESIAKTDYLSSEMVSSMNEEMFDVVDEHDQVLYQQPRSEVHRLKQLHRAVHILLFRSDGQMLIHKRSPDKEEFPSVWTSSASGHVSAGENYEATAPRELFEELGIRSALIPLHKFDACPETSFEFTVLFQASSDEAIVFDQSEITEVRWLNVQEIVAWRSQRPEDFSPAFCLLFDWYCQQLSAETLTSGHDGQRR